MEWLREKFKPTSRYPGSEILEWPALSPDLNAIENLWSELLESFSQDGVVKLSKDKFIERVEARLIAMENPQDPSYFHRLNDSMSDRMQQVVDAKGVALGTDHLTQYDFVFVMEVMFFSSFVPVCES